MTHDSVLGPCEGGILLVVTPTPMLENPTTAAATASAARPNLESEREKSFNPDSHIGSVLVKRIPL